MQGEDPLDTLQQRVKVGARGKAAVTALAGCKHVCPVVPLSSPHPAGARAQSHSCREQNTKYRSEKEPSKERVVILKSGAGNAIRALVCCSSKGRKRTIGKKKDQGWAAQAPGECQEQLCSDPQGKGRVLEKAVILEIIILPTGPLPTISSSMQGEELSDLLKVDSRWPGCTLEQVQGACDAPGSSHGDTWLIRGNTSPALPAAG